MPDDKAPTSQHVIPSCARPSRASGHGRNRNTVGAGLAPPGGSSLGSDRKRVRQESNVHTVGAGRASVMPLFGATHPSPESSPDRERRILQRLIPADHAVGAADYPPFGVDVIAPTISGVIAWHARHRLARTAKPSRLVGRRSGFGSALGIARR